ncbi:zinc finger 512B [Pelobates cultripes]|uniref:Zinc finger 512B n=1 Tax=Pelobates cultripes TaxID=61616 RepID=A0AAD1SJW5_PELCU|nr:zinc finger 512B [Pelobates cultripes]
MTESSGPADMANSTGTRRYFPRTSKSRATFQLSVHPSQDSSNCPANARRQGESSSQGLAQSRYPRTETREMQIIPAALIGQWKEMFKTRTRVKCPSSGCWREFPTVYSLKQHYQRCQGVGLSFRLRFSCPYCEAVFVSKSQLQKHLVWNHSDRGGNREQRPKQSAFNSGGKEREAEKPPPLHRHSKQAILRPPEENGAVIPHSRHAIQGADEDPGRMKHRRKQKTPKKFTGEQTSITGAFSLKGLGKTEDKSRGGRGRIVRGRTDESRKKLHSANARRENSVPLPGNLEDTCQRQVNKRGEVTCPNCVSVTRKTMAGLKKHMDVCEQLQEALRCQHCRKQFKSKAGLNYHTMAEHVNKSSNSEDAPLDEQKERERLRKVLKQMGKLRCAKQDCTATFSSLMGYQYHMQRCGREQTEGDKLRFSCPYCSKEYQSKAGRNYHVRSEHCAAPAKPAAAEEERELENIERTPSGRVRRQSAQLAVFHLQEIAEDELSKEGGRRRMREDLVPDSKRLNYLRPGLPTFNPQLLESWKTRVKENGFICCPNNCCEAIYSSVSGLKAHLASCSKGNHSVGKYRCLLCQKEFSSESGVKYHILKTHSQNWFRVSSVSSTPKRKATLNFPATESEAVTMGKNLKRRPPAAITAPLTKELPLVIKTNPMKLTSKPAGHAHSLSFKGTSRKGFPTRGRK